MNTPNNKRRRDSVRKIEKTFIELLQEKPLKEISVADICQGCGLNRSTFYANFVDIYDLADKLRLKLEAKFAELFSDFDPTGDTDSALRLFTHIRENLCFRFVFFSRNRQIHISSRAFI